MKTLVIVLAMGLVASNAAWIHSYNKQSAELNQTAGLLDEAESYMHKLPDTGVYQLSTVNGELRTHCSNGADATIRPTDEFGTIITSCGQ
jgi:hypothetical protein